MSASPATITVNRECSRCPRVDRTEVSIEEVVKLAKTGLKQPRAMRITMDGNETHSFDTLCGTCRQIVERGLAGLSKRLEQRSSVRSAADVDTGDPDEPDITITEAKE